MITGDHPVTALAIARELHLASEPDQVVSGASLSEDPAALRDAVERARVFARVAPHQKLQLVEAAQEAGHFVGVTGDGANDAPALRAANIGVAMGHGGTDVARGAADLVISDDNLATIVAGIEEGRIAYDNIRKVIYLLVSTNGAEVLMAVAAVALGLPLPLLPVQLLWLNLVTEGMQHVALAFEPGEDDVLKRPPRPTRERIFNRLMIERVLVGSGVMAAVSLSAFAWMLSRGWAEAEARNTLLLLMVLFENIQIGNSRSETRSGLLLSPLRSPLLLSAAAVALAVHIVVMQWGPAQAVLRTAPVDLFAWGGLLLLALSVFVAMELHKLLWGWRQRRKADRG
jgi:magnesium-transporting ATPase (P-type)